MKDRYIASTKKPDKYEDFKVFIARHPHLTTSEIRGAYHVTASTVYLWREKLKKEMRQCRRKAKQSSCEAKSES